MPLSTQLHDPIGTRALDDQQLLAIEAPEKSPESRDSTSKWTESEKHREITGENPAANRHMEDLVEVMSRFPCASSATSACRMNTGGSVCQIQGAR